MSRELGGWSLELRARSLVLRVVTPSRAVHFLEAPFVEATVEEALFIFIKNDSSGDPKQGK